MLPLPRPEVFVLAAWEKFGPDGQLNNDADQKQVRDLLTTLADWARLLERGYANSS